jgi:hypothetical protein
MFLQQNKNVTTMGNNGFCLPCITCDPTTMKDLRRICAKVLHLVKPKQMILMCSFF